MSTRKFLTAEWRRLVMANYIVEPGILQRYVPAKTELDFFHGACYLSLVGFLFTNVRVQGLKIPGHVQFPEVNLRFYVRHHDEKIKEWKRGVVFISEIVPKPAITWVANTLYREHYSTLPMKYHWDISGDDLRVGYQWKKRKHWNRLDVQASKNAKPLKEGSEEEFITEHFWGYSGLAKNKTAEYQVAHPRWEIFEVVEHSIDCDFPGLYGNDFAFLQQEKPDSVFLAGGSAVSVFSKKILK